MVLTKHAEIDKKTKEEELNYFANINRHDDQLLLNNGHVSFRQNNTNQENGNYLKYNDLEINKTELERTNREYERIKLMK